MRLGHLRTQLGVVVCTHHHHSHFLALTVLFRPSVLYATCKSGLRRFTLHVITPFGALRYMYFRPSANLFFPGRSELHVIPPFGQPIFFLKIGTRRSSDLRCASFSMQEALALIKLGQKGVIATLCADTAGDVGDWYKFRKLLPKTQPEGAKLPSTYNLQTMEEGNEVISTDSGRTRTTDLTGRLMGFYGAIYAGQPARFALIAKDNKLYFSGLMAKGWSCLVTPTGKASEETVTEAEVKAFLLEKTPRSVKRDTQDPDERKRKDNERKAVERRDRGVEQRVPYRSRGEEILPASKKRKLAASEKQEAVPQHTHTHTHTYRHRHTHTHSHAHAHTHTHTHTRTHACHAHACVLMLSP